jgi:NADH-quinone oxidoreductase subunit M
MYDRLHSREIKDYGGVVISMPIFASFMVLFALANSGLPGTSGFVGEFMVILASIKSSFWIAFLAAATLILGAAYSLWLIKRVIFGEITNPKVAEMQDLDGREFAILASLAFMVLLFGVWPNPIVEVMHPTIDNLLQHVVVSKL